MHAHRRRRARSPRGEARSGRFPVHRAGARLRDTSARAGRRREASSQARRPRRCLRPTPLPRAAPTPDGDEFVATPAASTGDSASRADCAVSGTGAPAGGATVAALAGAAAGRRGARGSRAGRGFGAGAAALGSDRGRLGGRSGNAARPRRARPPRCAAMRSRIGCSDAGSCRGAQASSTKANPAACSSAETASQAAIRRGGCGGVVGGAPIRIGRRRGASGREHADTSRDVTPERAPATETRARDVAGARFHEGTLLPGRNGRAARRPARAQRRVVRDRVARRSALDQAESGTWSMARTGGSGAFDGSAKTTPATEGGSSGAVAGRSARPDAAARTERGVALAATARAGRREEGHGARTAAPTVVIEPRARSRGWGGGRRGRARPADTSSRCSRSTREREPRRSCSARSVTMDTRPSSRT